MSYQYSDADKRAIGHVADLLAAASRQDDPTPVIADIDAADAAAVIAVLTTSAWNWLLEASRNDYDTAALKVEALRRFGSRRR
ncbi:hypothetical protein [Gordonia hongkongensis]|uniref:hypothetical protein n=1 Tax=Gordonia hongkongensis TaxID=1701090 RepID=UPI001FF776EA|nr:hypothetical protein [Gordonia hongkongensis]UPG69342.1 hypothetical protein MVF96_05830 [Gordonia hongkongensis]